MTTSNVWHLYTNIGDGKGWQLHGCYPSAEQAKEMEYAVWGAFGRNRDAETRVLEGPMSAEELANGYWYC